MSKEQIKILGFVSEKCGGNTLWHILNHLPPFAAYKLRNGTGVMIHIHCESENGKVLGECYWKMTQEFLQNQPEEAVVAIAKLLGYQEEN